MPKVSLGESGEVIDVVETFKPIISKTVEFISLSVIHLIYPFLTYDFQIQRGLEPMEYKIDKNPDQNLCLNIIKNGELRYGGFKYLNYNVFKFIF